MTIHVVKQGETIQSIADLYKLSVERLIIDNGIKNPNNLATGQTIVIVAPSKTYTVKAGDTLAGIAEMNGVSLMELLRNNPYLVDREYIYPGEMIVISYDTNKSSSIVTSGNAYPFINRDVLKKTLPYLTYLTIFNYRETAEGGVVDIDDQEIINIAKDYGVAPIMLVSTLTNKGVSSSEIATTLLNSPELQDRLIDNIMTILKKKGYYGLNQYFQYYNSDKKEVYLNYVKRLSARLKSEGYRFVITITPKIDIQETEINIEKSDYSEFTDYCDGILFITYNWAFSYGSPSPAAPYNLLTKIIENVTATIPPEKFLQGFPIIGYDWPLPYVPGNTMASAITSDTAIEIASNEGVPIQFDDISKAPYFFYYMNGKDLHNVWFKDARSVDAISALVPQYGLQGLSVWNIMYYFTQMWFFLNNKFEIEKVKNLEK